MKRTIKVLETIIYYPGSFDILHVGHINAIWNVREQCKNHNCLIKIGIESDKLLTSLKRKPIYNESERKNLIKFYSDLEPVIYYNYDYKNHCDYDIFACGPEFGNRKDQEDHLKWCKENKIDIIRVPRTEGISTSDIIRRIKNE